MSAAIITPSTATAIDQRAIFLPLLFFFFFGLGAGAGFGGSETGRGAVSAKFSLFRSGAP